MKMPSKSTIGLGVLGLILMGVSSIVEDKTRQIEIREAVDEYMTEHSNNENE